MSGLIKFLQLVSLLTLTLMAIKLSAKGSKPTPGESSTTPPPDWITQTCYKAWSYIPDADGNIDNDYKYWTCDGLACLKTSCTGNGQAVDCYSVDQHFNRTGKHRKSLACHDYLDGPDEKYLCYTTHQSDSGNLCDHLSTYATCTQCTG